MDTRHAPLPSRLREAAVVLGENPRDYDLPLQMTQFDAVFHLDETTAVEPMDSREQPECHITADTCPFGV